MKTIRKTLIPMSAVLAAATLPTAALADLHIHKKVDQESIVVIGPEVDELSVGQQLRVETDGSVGTITRIRGQKALVSVQSTDQLSSGDRVVLVRTRERAGVVPAESVVTSSERSERFRRTEETAASPVRFSLMIGGNRPMNTLQQTPNANNQFNSMAMFGNSMSYTFSILPEAALSYSLNDTFRIQASGSWVQKRSSTLNNNNFNNFNNFNNGGFGNNQMQAARMVSTQNSIQTAVEAQYIVPRTPLILSAGPFAAFPTSGNTTMTFGGQVFNQPVSNVGRRTDIGALIGLGVSAPVASNIELVGLGRYAHGTVTDTQTNQRTRDLRLSLGLSLSL